MVANFTPCDASVTVSRSGQRVAVMRRRSSVISSCGKLALKGWMDDSDVVDMTFSTVLPDVRMREDRSSGYRLQYPAVRVRGALLQVALAKSYARNDAMTSPLRVNRVDFAVPAVGP